MNDRGFLMMEAMLALAALGIGLIAWTGSFPSSLLAIRTLKDESGAYANLGLESTVLGLVRTGKIEHSGELKVLDLADEHSFSLSREVSWRSPIGVRTRRGTLSLTRTDAPLDGCDPLVTRDWARLRSSVRHRLSSDGLLRRFPSDRYRPSALAWHDSVLAVSMDRTGRTSSPTIALLAMPRDGEPGSVLTKFDNAATSRIGYSDVAWSGGTLLAANAFGSASTSTCAEPGACAQMHVLRRRGNSYVKTHLQLSTSSPPFAYRSGGSTAAATAVTVSGTIAVLGLEKTVIGTEANIIDVSDPSDPRWIAGVRIGRSVNSITIRDRLAYLATDDSNREVVVLDISSPHRPRVVAGWDAPGSNGFGFATDVVAHGGIVRVARSYVSNSAELAVISAEGKSRRDALATADLGIAQSPESIRDLITQDFLLVALGSKNIYAFAQEHGDPTVLREISSFRFGGSTEGVTFTCIGDSVLAGLVDSSTGSGYLQRFSGE